jgi:hypothetical protein
MSELGILPDARSVHPGLSARNNLLALARTSGIGRRRVEEVIELAGLGEVAGARAGPEGDGLQHVCDEVEVAAGGGQALRGSDTVVLAEQPPEHLQVPGRSSVGCVRSADELHHASRVGRPARDPFGGHGDERHLQEPVRIGRPGRRGLDLALGQVLVEGVA